MVLPIRRQTTQRVISIAQQCHEYMQKLPKCQIVTKEDLSFQKYPAIHAPEERHGLDLNIQDL